MMERETVSDIRARYAETDQMGVVYHANYLVWCEIGRTEFIRSRGMSYADMERQGIKDWLRNKGSEAEDDAARESNIASQQGI